MSCEKGAGTVVVIHKGVEHRVCLAVPKSWSKKKCDRMVRVARNIISDLVRDGVKPDRISMF